MTREDYDRYVAAFNARDYDAVFDFYAENPRMAFFGVEIRTREQLRDFYTFLHGYVRETVTVERFACERRARRGGRRGARWRPSKDLTREALDARGPGAVLPHRRRALCRKCGSIFTII